MFCTFFIAGLSPAQLAFALPNYEDNPEAKGAIKTAWTEAKRIYLEQLGVNSASDFASFDDRNHKLVEIKARIKKKVSWSHMYSIQEISENKAWNDGNS